MTDERFVLKFDSQENEYFIRDNFEEEEELGSYTLKWGVRKLNEQQNIIEEQNKEIEESRITIQLYETDVSMRDNFLKSKGLYDEFLQCIMVVNE